MSAAVWGEPGAMPVILLHGIPTNALIWRRIGPTLSAEGFRAFAPDLLGYGKSGDPTSAKYGVADQARYLYQFVSGLGLKDTIVIGHDIGGGIAQQLAVSHPELVIGLVLVNSVTERNWPPLIVRSTRSQPFAAVGSLLERVFGFERVLSRLIRSAARHPARLTAQALEAYAAPIESRGGASRLAQLAAGLSSNDTAGLTAKLAVLPMPKLIVWGADDPYLKVASGRKLAAELPGSTFVEIPSCGHFVPEEEPFGLADAVLPFLRERLPERQERATGRLRRTGEFPKIELPDEDV